MSWTLASRLFYGFLTLPGLRQLHTALVKAWLPNESDPDELKDALYNWKYMK